MSDWIFWLVILAWCAFLYWAAFYATKDMRIKKKRLLQEQAQKNLQAAVQKKSETPHGEDC